MGEIPHIISIRLADMEEKRLYYGDRDLQKTGWYRVNPGRNRRTDAGNETAKRPRFGYWKITLLYHEI
jgi:hypothetical protein